MKQKPIKLVTATLCLLVVLFVQPIVVGAQTGQRSVGTKPIKEMSESIEKAKALSALRSAEGYDFNVPTVEYIKYHENRSHQIMFRLLASASASAEKVYLRLRLKNPTLRDQLRLAIKLNEATEKLLEIDLNGMVWIDPEDCLQDSMGQYVFLNFYSSSIQSFEYELNAFASKDTEGEALASTTSKFVVVQELPRITATSRIGGDINTDIPLKIQITPGSFGAMRAKLRINVSGVNLQFFSITGDGLKKEDDSMPGWWTYDIANLNEANQYVFTVRSTEACTGTFDTRLSDENFNDFDWIHKNQIVIPTIYNEAEIEGLKALATANPSSADLRDFIAKELWKEDRDPNGNYKIGVSWDTQTPSNIESLTIRDQREAVTKLDLTPFSQLKSLNITECFLEKLDISSLSMLQILSVYGTPLLFTDVTFPDKLPDNLRCNGSSTIMVGTPIDNYTSSAPIGTEIDLSPQAEVRGVNTIYTWHEGRIGDGKEVSMPTAEGQPGKFIFNGEPGKYYYCEMSNPTFRNWTIRTVDIKVLRTNVTYSEQDVAAIKKIATDNPDNKKLKEYISTEGWKIENWDSRLDIIRTNWNYDSSPVRLTHLRIEPMWGQDERIDSLFKLDVTKFTELRHLECISANGITELDLSKNTKLEVVRVYSEELKSLDVSKSPNLVELFFSDRYPEFMGNINTGSKMNILTNLVFTGCSKLTKFELKGSPIARLDLTKTTLLEHLFIQNCNQLTTIDGFDSLSKLQALGLMYTGEALKKYATKIPASVVYLYFYGSDYPAPDAAVLNRLEEYGVPNNLETLDMQLMPKLRNLSLWDSNTTFSKIKNPKDINSVSYDGQSIMPVYGSLDDGRLFQNGDTIDLSSEAVIAGRSTTFIWVNQKYGTEEKEAIKQVPNRPGVFTIDSKDDQYGGYTCLMGNPLFTREITINRFSGWRVRTSYIHVQTDIEETFDERDVNTLATIVKNSSNVALNEWFGSGAWRKNGGTDNDDIYIKWNDNNPKRITFLCLDNMGSGLAKSLDVSGLNMLSTFECVNNDVVELKLPANLTSLDVSENRNLAKCDLSKNGKLVYLYCNYTPMPAISFSNFPALKHYGVPMNVKTLDLATSQLEVLHTEGSPLKFSDISNPYQLTELSDVTSQFAIGDIRGIASTLGKTIDYSAEMKVGETASAIIWKVFSFGKEPSILSNTEGTCQIAGDEFAPGDTIQAVITNSLFPLWRLSFKTIVYSCAGDANLDKDVNVRDVTATVSYSIKDKPNMINPFGFLEADVNEDDQINVADVVSIVNLIQNRPVAKSNALRADYTPTVKLGTDEKGYLYMDAPVAIAGIQFAFTGVKNTLSLVGKAAQMAQASAIDGDTLRILAYGSNGQTIPAGKTLLMQLPKDARLVSAAFSDANGRSLKSDQRDVVTSNETIDIASSVVTIHNYPNPFEGITTFAYTLAENAEQASIQIFSANGLLVQTLNGLPADEGKNTYTCTIQLSAGVYYYRLLLKGQGNTRISKSNQFIIK